MLEFCEEETLRHPKDEVSVVFPKTQAGYINSTMETCYSEDNSATGTWIVYKLFKAKLQFRFVIRKEIIS